MFRLDHVCKAFDSTVAVGALTLNVRDGEIFGLLGPNGAGKTTTIAMLTGQLAPDAGRIEVDGAGAPTDPNARRRIGVAPQALSLYEELTGEQNVRLFGQLYGLRGGHLTERVWFSLDLVGLTERARSRVKTYSGGMQRRLNLAIAVVHDPTALLLDEPTAGVDPQSRNAIFDFVQTLNAEGRTVLYTTHYMEEAQRLCHRVGIMDRGRLLALDTVDRLIAAHGGRSTVIVEGINSEQRVETDDPKAELTRTLSDPGVIGVRVERPNLESVFLSLTGRKLRD